MLNECINRGILRVVLAGLMLVLGTGPVMGQDDNNSMGDDEITSAVEGVLFDDPGVNANQIDVETLEGVVTLSGTVDNILAKERSSNLSRAVKGVRAVVNQVEVKPTVQPDSVIRQAVTDALLQNPVTETWEIGVSVEDAEVILTGTVDSWQKKQMAARVAKGVRGVEAVDNQIEVVYGETRTDAQIRKEVKSRLRWDALVDDALINVKVENGVVTLSGAVGSLSEKSEASADAWVTGVTDVITEELDVAFWEEFDKLRDDKYKAKPDSEIRQAIQDAFSYDPRVNEFDLTVSVDSGRVTLSGTVDSLSARRAAGQDARNTVGVWSVDNVIRVRPPVGLNDRLIGQRVRNALDADPYVEEGKINVRVQDAKVYLVGSVDSSFDKMHAEYVVSDVVGVGDVFNRLTVEREQSFGYEPRTDEWYGYDYDWFHQSEEPTHLNDWEITEQIKDELFWSPFVSEKSVDVSVDNGKAQLSGTVDTWGEREVATECAFKGGAIAVENNLKVESGPEHYQP